jgi:threonylcarbamoyladenosine tRNA methylthiotransferase CDKAL1
MFLFIVKASKVPRCEIMRIFVKNYGCSANMADSEAIAGCLAQAGYLITDSALAADVIVYNTCAVKGPTENRVIQALKRVPRCKKLVVAGCLPLINFERLSREVDFDGVVGPAPAEQIVDVIKRVLGGEKVVELQDSVTAKPSLGLPALRHNPVVSVLPVSYGCLGSCAYCSVVFARGYLRSYSVEEIVERMEQDLAEGAKEFWVTAQDTACYGRDIGTTLALLLKGLCALDGDFRVRVGMMTPNMANEILDDLVEAFRDSRIFKFVHLPVQSGDDEILRHMGRFYTVQRFREVVSAFRDAFSDVSFATDIICGFPGETREAFRNTLKLISEIKPDIVNVSKFFARPGTAAAMMPTNKFVEPGEIKLRSTEAAKAVKQISFENNQRWVGWTGEIFIDEKGKFSNSWVGRNFAYKPVTVKSSVGLLGKTLRVKVINVFPTHLNGTSE